MISSIEITRFRGIREGKLDNLTPLTILVGPNGYGKSSALDALLIAANSRIREGIVRAVQRHKGVRYGAPWLLWRKGVRGHAELKIRTDFGYERVCKLTCESQSDPGPVVICDANDEETEQSGRVVVAFLSENEQDHRRSDDTLTPPSFLGLVRLIQGHDNGEQTSLDILLTEADEQGVTDEVLAILKQIVPDIQELTLGSERGTALLYVKHKDHALPAALAGDGMYSLVRLCLQLATYPCGMVLLEEPETHQHPGAIRQTVRAILAAVRRNIQIILSTHSLELIDAVVAEASEEDIANLSLYRLELDNGRLITVRHEGADVEFARCQVERDLR